MYEWDDAKDAANIVKHGIGFDTAIRIFDGPVLRAVDDRLGIIRIISARRANRNGSKRYAAAI